MAAIKEHSSVQFTNTAGRSITGTVTKLEGVWVTVFECPGSVYKLPKSALKLIKSE
jgi:hypothetical protein